MKEWICWFRKSSAHLRRLQGYWQVKKKLSIKFSRRCKPLVYMKRVRNSRITTKWIVKDRPSSVSKTPASMCPQLTIDRQLNWFRDKWSNKIQISTYLAHPHQHLSCKALEVKAKYKWYPSLRAQMMRKTIKSKMDLSMQQSMITFLKFRLSSLQLSIEEKTKGHSWNPDS